MEVSDPIQIGELLRKLFIVRPDGSVDHDMVVALAQAANLHFHDKDQSREPAGLDGEFRP